MNAFVRKLLFGLALLIAVSAIVLGGIHVYRMATTPSFAKSGGTILVYEVDPEARLDGPPSDYRPEDLAEAIKRRIDPTGREGIIVRPAEPGRVEIAVPRSGDHAAQVQGIKDLIAQQGRLEFRIVANRFSDGTAFQAAEEYFRTVGSDVQRQQDLRRAAETGRPPPAPVITNPDEQSTYSWVELGPTERASLALNKSSQAEQRWQEAAEARTRGRPFVIEYPAGGGRNEAAKGSTSMMLWSRKCENLHFSPAERDGKGFDYFMLVRNPATPALAVTGKNLVDAQVDDLESPSVGFTFNAAGGRLFGQLTSDNLPVGKEPSLQYSSICIILDGQIMSAPSLNTAIHERGQIVGRFTVEEAQRLAQILRAGALPAALKPQPVSEALVEPK